MSGARAKAAYVPDLRGWAEIVVRDATGNVVGIVTRPCAGAKWFLHRPGSKTCRGEPFTTKKAAIEAATRGA